MCTSPPLAVRHTRCIPGLSYRERNHASVLQRHALYGIFSGLTWLLLHGAKPAGETVAAARLMEAIEVITANPDFHTPDLGGTATTDQVTAAIIDVIRARNN